MRVILFIAATAGFVFWNLQMQAQQPAFYHLSTAEGLSDNNVNHAARDRNGILWVATTEGLNSFDGNRITTYYKQKYPQLPDNVIERIVIDDDNHIWIRTNTSFVTMLDKKRKFHKYGVGDTLDGFNVSALFKTSSGIIAVKNRNYYLLKNDSLSFEKISTPFDSLLGGTGFAYYPDNDKVIYYRDGKLLIADFAKMRVTLTITIPQLNGAFNLDENNLIAFDRETNIFYRISISDKKIISQYSDLRDQYGLPITGILRNMTRIDENRIAFTTYFSGLYIINFSERMAYHYTHDPVDPRSIGGNNTFNIVYDSSGYLFVTTQTSGLHFLNLGHKHAFSKTYFIDHNKQVFDGYIHSITTDGEDYIWMGAQDRLIKWNRTTDRTIYVPIRLPGNLNILGTETIREVLVDESGKLWVGTGRFGVLILNKSMQFIKQITDSSEGKRTNFPSRWINAICIDKHGNKWIGTLAGTCIITKENYNIISLDQHPLLSVISKIPCASLWMDEEGQMWIGTTRGVWCYNETKNTLVNYSKREGLLHNTVNATNKDLHGNIYFTTSGGLSILSKDGVISSYDRSNGLRNDRCEGILRDENGFMWFGNLNCIVRYDPVKKIFAVYEEGYGFSHGGFRMRCAYKSNAGEMFWGTDNGLVYFFPEQMSSSSLPLRPCVTALQADDNYIHFTEEDEILFEFNTNSFVFYFSTGELTGDKKNQLLYRLSGYDEKWRTPVTTGQAAFSKLQPGTYQFEIKASHDGVNWFDGAYPVIVTVNKPWWQSWWFRSMVTALAVGAIYLAYNYYRKRKMAREKLMQLNVKMAESKFMNLRLQMNPHFLFNSLSSIQHLIVSNQTTKAYKYLTIFSNFLRSLLNYAEKNFIPLDEEIKILNMYVELESLRFDKSFQYEITVDDNLSNDEVFVPSLIIQPFAENAIWHGLLHKEGEKKLTVRFSGDADEVLQCIIEDNGIGREKAAAIKNNNISNRVHESKGVAIVRERLSLLQQKTGKPASIEFEDISPSGTRVTIFIPYYYPEEL